MRSLIQILCFLLALGLVACRKDSHPEEMPVNRTSSFVDEKQKTGQDNFSIQIGKTEEIALLKDRALGLVGKGNYKTAKHVLDDVLELDRDLSLLMLRCMLGERTGENGLYVQRCYQQVAEAYSEIDGEDPLNEINRVGALLFARAPQAQLEAEKLMESLKGTELEDISLILFKDFDREAYLSTILP
ncbi:hypothetical protein SAMN05660860_03201 [Geoalkalibacter ferrihydriticus]|uniref:Lipoprotein n=2 Tax=Geoalkalibacter ferrihydriticus TaxID=392333 RepID=A0A0C2HM54_9BACT|nr:hypothetical protein [Geoalkalibacter ferrihydriticus]KIH78136.1 hypothetical protein GFER_06080 [Geoalkalibacter ferrihydriticus DSM 17813]SDM80567.1 hypothetical protein SAMN05660860_03201 [Geoalkalibacter ferrihydriticus]